MGITTDKGNELEEVVESIEKFLISQNPTLKSEDITLQRKKIITVDDVKHEIDIYVQINLGLEHPFIYIFECKNWEENVGKNEIIVFSEKIQCVNAQNGYFIAKGFTIYAEAQAKKDPRVSLLLATPELNKFPYLEFSNSFSTDAISAEFAFWDENEELISFEPGKSKLTVNDEAIGYSVLGSRLINDFVTKKYDTPMELIQASEESGFYMGYVDENHLQLPIGEHIFEDHFMYRVNDARIYVDETTPIEKISCKAKLRITITAPIFVWQYDVEKKGKVVLIRYELPRGTVEIKAVGSDKHNAVHLETKRIEKIEEQTPPA